jgi:hypothetical protein
MTCVHSAPSLSVHFNVQEPDVYTSEALKACSALNFNVSPLEVVLLRSADDFQISALYIFLVLL